MKLTAGAPSHTLVRALERAGWGTLAGPEFRGVRGVLAALTRTLDPRSGQGHATAWQIAEQAGYTERWTRRCLVVLEELELIEWDRGGVIEGKPVPSWFRVSKRALLILVSIARQKAGERRAEHQAEVRERVQQYSLHRVRKQRKRRPVHAEVISALLSTEEVPDETRPPVERPEMTREAISDAVAKVRAQIQAGRRLKATAAQARKTATTETALNGPAYLQGAAT